ncbi:uncharacterized protein LOC142803994 [Rhipicephalus microplus]|uniref:uncharacterized protein LOC142803994 n=1 Tax=Rhipicephalus microplus TaxID=6941 RepID=UPI003F6D2A56
MGGQNYCFVVSSEWTLALDRSWRTFPLGYYGLVVGEVHAERFLQTSDVEVGKNQIDARSPYQGGQFLLHRHPFQRVHVTLVIDESFFFFSTEANVEVSHDYNRLGAKYRARMVTLPTRTVTHSEQERFREVADCASRSTLNARSSRGLLA